MWEHTAGVVYLIGDKVMIWRDLGNFGWEDWDRSTLHAFKRLQQEVNRLFEDNWPAGGSGFPPVNVWSDNERAVITAEIPGVDPKELELSVLGSVLTIGGERCTDEPAEKERYLRRERAGGKFTRTVELPFPVNGEGVEASCVNGVLKVVLQRTEADKPRKISVAS
jgi:HSP20 family protein